MPRFYRKISGSGFTFPGELMRKLRSQYSGERGTPKPTIGEPYLPLRNVEYPRESYNGSFHSPGYELAEPVEEIPLERKSPNMTGLDSVNSELFPEPPFQDDSIDPEPMLPLEIFENEIENAIELAANGITEPSPLVIGMGDSGFFNDGQPESSNRIDEVIDELLFSEGPADGLEQHVEPLMDDPMMNDPLMDDPFGGPMF